MKKLIIPILLLAALLAPSCIPNYPRFPSSPGEPPETIGVGKTIITDIRKYHVSEFSYCGRRYLFVEAADGRSNVDFEIIPIF